MTKLEFTCSDEKSVFLLKASRLYDEGVKLEPVRHGRWEHGMQCPFCKQIDTAKPNYCCNCGAKLDRGEKDAFD